MLACPAMLTRPETTQHEALSTQRTQTIVIGQTTRDEVEQAFGPPKQIATDPQGNDVWVYADHSFQSTKEGSFAVAAGGGLAGPVPMGGAAKATSEYERGGSRVYTMCVHFNGSGVVAAVTDSLQKK